MAFWTTPASQNADPKRNFRFFIQITSLGGKMWWAKGISKPSYTVGSTTHQYLNHNYYFPGRVEWDAVTATFVDPQDPDFAKMINQAVEAGGYQIPSNENEDTTIGKSTAVAALGNVICTQIDSDGDAVESWILHNAFITKVTHSELSYDNEDLSTVEVEFRYDWAELEAGDGTAVFSS